MSYKTALEGERDHPLYRTAAELEQYLGLSCDLIHLTILMSVAGGCMVTPLPIVIYSNSLTADLMVAHRILDLLPGRSRRVDTHKQFRELEWSRTVSSTCSLAGPGGSIPTSNFASWSGGGTLGSRRS